MISPSYCIRVGKVTREVWAWPCEEPDLKLLTLLLSFHLVVKTEGWISKALRNWHGIYCGRLNLQNPQKVFNRKGKKFWWLWLCSQCLELYHVFSQNATPLTQVKKTLSPSLALESVI